MKNIFYILLLLPTFIFAQYPSNGNQKITLGEQTTADGLIFRGVAATDTVRKPSIDTMAYMVLDTTTNIIWHYKKATSNAWLRLNLLPSDTASFNYVNTYGTQTVNGAKTFTTAPTFSTALSVASGGTGRTTMPAGYILHGDGTSVDTAIGLFWQRNVNRLGINNNNPSGVLDVKGDIILNAGGVQFPIQLRNDFTPNIQRADLMFLGNSTSDNGFRWGSISSSGGVTFQATKFSDSGIKTNITLNPDGGNVGIGTASPGNLLTIKDKSQIGFRDEASNSTRNALQNYAYTLGYGDGLRIGEQYNAVSIAGNVGIGTTSPTEKLHVVGNGLFTGNVGIGSATPTTSGSGITFPATQSASTNVNTLDDYEEGTWTPVYQGLGGSIGSTAYSVQRGRYTKIGRFCHASGEITLTNKGSWSSGVVITGLPFTTTAAESAFGFIILGFVDLDAGVKYCQFRGTGGANNNAYIDTILDNADRVILFTTAINNNSTFEFSFIYTVN